MTASHPPTLLTLTRRSLRVEGVAPRGSRVLLAVSGGPDSMALLHVMARLAPDFGLSVMAHGVDHGLRPEAPAELDLAASLAARLGVPFDRTVVSVAAGGNLQARARTARYCALRAAAARHGAARIATAHHADDRAETVILRLLRGAGPRGLAVLRLRSGDLIRPFLRARRGDVDAHVARHTLPFAVDPSNGDPKYARVRVRHEVLPLLASLSPAIVPHLCALADALGASERGVTSAAGSRGDGAGEGADPAEIPDAYTVPLARVTQEALDAWARQSQSGGAKVTLELRGGVVATYDRGSLKLVKSDQSAPRWRNRGMAGTCGALPVAPSGGYDRGPRSS